MTQNIKLQLTSIEHGFDDFDVIDHPEIRRVTVGHTLECGDVFNVYGPDGTKRGATWCGTVEASLASFLLISADTIAVSREMSNSFDYQLLGRLQQDCEYYLGEGARNAKRLWALDVSLQIQKMKELYEKLPIKPEWLTLEEIECYEQKMNEPARDTEQPRG